MAVILFHLGTPTTFGASASNEAQRGTAITDAMAAAVSGDDIYVWFGNGVCTIASTLGKSGVRLIVAVDPLIDGATTVNGSSGVEIFSDSGSAKAFKVLGRGDFVGVGANCHHTSHANSVFTLFGNGFSSTGSSVKAAMWAQAGTLNCYCANSISSADYDGIVCETGGHTHTIRCAALQCGDENSCFEQSGEGDTVNLHAASLLTDFSVVECTATTGVINIYTDQTIDGEALLTDGATINVLAAVAADPPNITSDDTIECDEGETGTILTVTCDDASELFLSGGDDVLLFSLTQATTTTATLKFLSAPAAEEYVVKVMAQNVQGFDEQEITVTVSEVEDDVHVYASTRNKLAGLIGAADAGAIADLLEAGSGSVSKATANKFAALLGGPSAAALITAIESGGGVPVTTRNQLATLLGGPDAAALIEAIG